ncbi:hypothetical protein ACFQ1I_01585 [Kitasatospora arboriphila]
MPAKSLQELVDLARTHSPFYAEAYRAVPRTVSHITQLPLVDQDAFWAATRGNRLLTGPLTDAGVYKSGGTTGAPKLSPWTRTEHAEALTAFGAGMVQAASSRATGSPTCSAPASSTAASSSSRAPCTTRRSTTSACRSAAPHPTTTSPTWSTASACTSSPRTDEAQRRRRTPRPARGERRIGRTAAVRRRPALHRSAAAARPGLPQGGDLLGRLRLGGRRPGRLARPRRRRPGARGLPEPHAGGDRRQHDRRADHHPRCAGTRRRHQPLPHPDADPALPG